MAKRFNDQPIPVMDTKDMTAEEFTYARKQMGGLGGSDAGAICGLSHFDSPLNRWAKKTGRVSDAPVSDYQSYLFKAGHLLEDAVANLFIEQLKINEPLVRAELVPDTIMYQAGRTNPDGTLRWPFLFVDLDYRLRINGKHDGILECKTISGNSRDKIRMVKAGICPPDYECQVRAYMAAVNVEFAYIAFMWGTSPDEFAYILIPRDYDKEEKIMQRMEYFYNCMVNDVEPVELKCIYPELEAEYKAAQKLLINENGYTKVDSVEYADAILRAFELDKEIDELARKKARLDAEREEIHNLFYDALGDCGKGSVVLPDGRHAVITQKMHYTKESFNEKEFAADNPEIYAEYQKTSFNTSKFKKDYPLLYAKYAIAPQPKTDEPRSFSLSYERDTDVPGINGATVQKIKRTGPADEDAKRVKAAIKEIEKEKVKRTA